MRLRSVVVPAVIAPATVLIGMALAVFVAAGERWTKPDVVMSGFPFVTNVPPRLFVAFIVVTMAPAVLAALVWVLFLRAPGAARIAWLAALMLLSSAVSVWNGLDLAAVRDPMPVLDWLFFTIPAVTAAWVCPRRGKGRADIVATVLLISAPVAAANTLAWSIQVGNDPVFGAEFTTVMGGFGLLVALPLSALRGGIPHSESRAPVT
jgi:hypothetical protein